MTNEEAIKELKYFSDILVKTSKVINSPFDLNEVNFVFKSEFLDTIAESITALEKSEKYRWHDLRKNPNDLPSEDGVYRCVFKDEVNSYFDCDYRKGIGFGKECFLEHDELPGSPKEYYFEGFDEDDEVIGWQEREPFEEVSE